MAALGEEDLQNQCEICLEQKFKYKCPKCGMKTCSLECVKRHKLQAECDGVVDNTRFVKRSEFQQDQGLVQRDYNFLTNLTRTISTSKQDVRQKNKKILMSNSHHSNPNKRFQKNRVSQNEEKEDVTFHSVVKRGVNVRYLPRGMQRSNMNKSGWDKKKDTYVWTVEFILIDSETGGEVAKQVSYRVPEGSCLKECTPVKVMEGIAQDFLPHFFLKKVDTPASEPGIIPLNQEGLLADLLRNRTVIEFPTILVSSKGEIRGFKVYVDDDEGGSSEQNSSDDDSSNSDDEDSSSEGSDDDRDEEDRPEEESAKQAPVSETILSMETAPTNTIES